MLIKKEGIHVNAVREMQDNKKQDMQAINTW